MIGMKQEINEHSLLGIFIKMNSIEVIELVAWAGFDFIIIDMEHAPLTFQDVKVMTTVAQGYGLKVVVRTGDFSKSTILHALDLGIDGIQIPQINNKQEAQEVVNASKYSPKGNRGVAFSTRASRYGFLNGRGYMDDVNENLLTSVHIETKEALENVKEIVDVEGIDVLFLGPTDLSYSLGVDEDYIHGGLKEAFFAIKEEVKRAGKQMGIAINDESKLEFCLDNDVHYIVWGTDIGFLKKQLSNITQIIKKHKK